MPTPQSKKRNRTLIALVFVLFVLVSFAQFFSGEETADSRHEFTTLTSKQINKIEVESLNNPKMSFEKLDHGWYLTKPFKRRADNSRIQVLLATLSLPKPNIYNSQEVDASSLGLEPAKATMTLNDTVFFFGNTGNNNDRRYLQTEDKITLAADIIFPLFSQGLFGFIEKTLVPPGFVHIESSSYTLRKTGKLWQSHNGTIEDAESIVAAWLGQLSEDVLAWPLTSSIEDAIKHNVTFKMEKGDTLNLEIFEMQDLSLLHPENSGYALVITPEQFASLGITSD